MALTIRPIPRWNSDREIEEWRRFLYRALTETGTILLDRIDASAITEGSLIFPDADGVLIEDATNLTFNTDTNLLTIGNAYILGALTVDGLATFNGETSGIDHSDLDELNWSVAAHVIDADIVMNDFSLTGVDIITFTDVNGTIAGIENQNLLDKTAAESLSGLYTWTSGGIHLNDDIPFSLGNTSASPDVIIDYDAANSRLGIDLTTGTRGTGFNIATDIAGQAYNISSAGAHSINRFLDTATGNVLTISGSSREEAAALRALRFTYVHNPNVGASSSTVQGISGDVTIGGNQNTTGTATGGNFLVIHDSSAIATKVIGTSIAIQNTTGTITTSVGLEVCAPVDTAGTWTNNYGIYVEAQDVNLTTAINAAMWLEPSSNATVNYGIVLDGDGLGSDISLGAGQNNKIYSEITTNNLILDSAVVGTGSVKTTAGRIVNTTRLINTDSPYTVLATDHIILCDTDAGAIEVDLTAGVEGKEYRIQNVGSSGNDVTVDPNGAEQVFAGGAGVAFIMTNTEGITINYNSTEGWW